MAKTNVVTIEHLEVKKRDIEIVKKAFNVKDTAEAVRRAIDLASGKLELESIFERYKGTKMRKSMIEKIGSRKEDYDE